MDELIKEGYIEKGELDGRTNAYTITDKGGEKLRARTEWERERLEERSTADA